MTENSSQSYEVGGTEDAVRWEGEWQGENELERRSTVFLSSQPYCGQ